MYLVGFVSLHDHDGSYPPLTQYLIVEGQNVKTQEVKAQVGKRIAFVESLVNTSKTNDISTSVGGMATDTPTQELSQQKENSEHKKLRKNGNFASASY